MKYRWNLRAVTSCFANCSLVLLAFAGSSLSVAPAWAELPGMKSGAVQLKSAGPMAFATSGVLIVGDPAAATVYALDTNDREEQRGHGALEIADVRASIAGILKCDASDITIGDLAVNPLSGNVYLNVAQGNERRIIRVTRSGDLTALDLNKIDFAMKALPNPPADEVTGEGNRRRNRRNESITDVAFFEGRVIVSGMAAGDSPSAVLEFPFPFGANSVVTSVEIYHAAHGKVEDAAIRTFVPFTVGGEPSLLAGFTCTPLVNFPINALEGTGKVRGKTVAELGNRNQPLDMFVYRRDGRDFVLLSNSVRGVMKVSTQAIEENPGLKDRVEGGGTAGQPFETVSALAGISEMDKLDEQYGVAVFGKSDQVQSLRTFELP